ncbi:hypothetical protein F8C76_01605 [Flagellimonas olearia]|uniref:Uncharacterized protein n=1 Tax=Flagellimonas olearia TaxID=552546 RepID=A0A6I1E0W2_9FLAO|nr:hypothetical protein F8C76_01605 [Allomuricauda olearia]
MGDTIREANTSEVRELRWENSQFKETVAELLLHNRVLKNKSEWFRVNGGSTWLNGDGDRVFPKG